MKISFKKSPWAHQKETVEHVVKNNISYYGLFYEQGCGKSKTAVDIYRNICLRDRVLHRLLIIAPLITIRQWKGEILENTNLDPDKIMVVDGKTRDKKVKQLKDKKAKIFVVNTEIVANKTLWPLVMQLQTNFLIVDESHRFKTHNSIRTKNLHKWLLSPTAPFYRFILTGTPITNNAMDIWAQFFILDHSIFDKNFFNFRGRYFYDKNVGMPKDKYFPKWVPIKGSENELNYKIFKHAKRVTKDEVLDLPEFVRQRVDVELEGEQKRLYKQMKEAAVAVFERDKIDDLLTADLEKIDVMSADLAIVKLLRLQQILGGVFVGDDGTVKTFLNNRVKVLSELLEDLLVNPTNKIVIWTTWSHTYDVIADVLDKFKVNYAFITGRQNSDEKFDAVDGFQNGNIRVIIANQAAAGTGVNLTAGNYAIYFTRSFNLEHDLQSEARIHRGGQSRTCFRIDLVSPGTLDEDILNALDRKKRNAENILQKNKNTVDEFKEMLYK